MCCRQPSPLGAYAELFKFGIVWNSGLAPVSCGGFTPRRYYTCIAAKGGRARERMIMCAVWCWWRPPPHYVEHGEHARAIDLRQCSRAFSSRRDALTSHTHSLSRSLMEKLLLVIKIQAPNARLFAPTPGAGNWKSALFVLLNYELYPCRKQCWRI